MMSKDRRDGKYIKQTDGVHKIFPYIYDKRTECEVHSYKTLDITKLMKYLDNLNKDIKDSNYKFTLFQALITISAKTLYLRPALNRFVQGKRYYQRNNVSLAFVAKNKFSDEAEERLIVLETTKNMNIKSINKQIITEVKKVRSNGTNNIDNILNSVCILPRWLLSIFVNLMKKLDYYGKVPKSLTEGDINFASILLTNLGSIKCDAVYHHLNNYGTNSILISIGVIKENKGKKTVTIGITCDERIADGFYFAKSLKIFDYILDNPNLLEKELDEKISLDI